MVLQTGARKVLQAEGPLVVCSSLELYESSGARTLSCALAADPAGATVTLDLAIDGPSGATLSPTR